MVDRHLHVVDIYHGNDVSSFKKAHDAGIWGIIHKASTGATGRDKKYADRRKAAIKAGLLWGAYHWGTAADVKKQVKNFLTAASPDASTLVALDFEEDKKNGTMSLAQARQFLELVETELGRKAVLYSGHLIKDKLGSKKDAFFGGHRLWLAHYNAKPTIQKSWGKFWIWQYTDSIKGLTPNKVPGIPGNSAGSVDCNSYEGTKDQLAKEWAS